MNKVLSLSELYEKLGEAKSSVLLLTKSGSENSDCAFNNL